MKLRSLPVAGLCIAFLLVAFMPRPAVAEHTREQVAKMILDVGNALKALQANPESARSQEVAASVTEYLGKAQKQLDKKETEEAYYSVKIANEYLELLDARVKLQIARKAYEANRANEAARGGK